MWRKVNPVQLCRPPAVPVGPVPPHTALSEWRPVYVMYRRFWTATKAIHCFHYTTREVFLMPQWKIPHTLRYLEKQIFPSRIPTTPELGARPLDVYRVINSCHERPIALELRQNLVRRPLPYSSLNRLLPLFCTSMFHHTQTSHLKPAVRRL